MRTLRDSERRALKPKAYKCRTQCPMQPEPLHSHGGAEYGSPSGEHRSGKILEYWSGPTIDSHPWIEFQPMPKFSAGSPLTPLLSVKFRILRSDRRRHRPPEVAAWHRKSGIRLPARLRRKACTPIVNDARTKPPKSEQLTPISPCRPSIGPSGSTHATSERRKSRQARWAIVPLFTLG